jgi:hypothetical protein
MPSNASGGLHGPPRWTVVVLAQDATRYARVCQQFAWAPWVAVYLDRRRADRRGTGELAFEERRFADRRANGGTTPLRRTHRLAHEHAGVAVYELVDLEAGTDCPTCGATIWFEMPRFGEPPAQLTVTVEHEDVTARRARHLVTLEAFGVTGRGLLSSQVVARASPAGYRDALRL